MSSYGDAVASFGRICARKFDKFLYFSIGTGTAALSVKWTPHEWQFWVAVSVAGFTALKAKRSRSTSEHS